MPRFFFLMPHAYIVLRPHAQIALRPHAQIALRSHAYIGLRPHAQTSSVDMMQGLQALQTAALCICWHQVKIRRLDLSVPTCVCDVLIDSHLTSQKNKNLCLFAGSYGPQSAV